MRKIKNFLVGIIAMALLSNPAIFAFAQETGDTDAVISAVEESQLGQYAVENEENIVLVDEQGLILNEFHSDG